MSILHDVYIGFYAIFLVCCRSALQTCFLYEYYGGKVSGPLSRSNYCSCCGREIDDSRSRSQGEWDRLSTISEAETVFSDASSATLTYDQPRGTARMTMPSLIDMS